MVDIKKNNSVEIQQFIQEMVFLLRAPLKEKFALFFEVYINVTKEKVVPRKILGDIVRKTLSLLEEVYGSAK